MSEQSKIDALEMKIAFLEDTLEKLSDEFYQQQTQVAMLKAQQTKLFDQIRTVNEANNTEQIISEEKPPHY